MEALMPTASFSVSTFVNVPPEAAFAYTADLARHGEWSADPVHIEPDFSGPVQVGSRYHSTAQSHGITFRTDLVVSRLEPPRLFAFEGHDATSKFRHIFRFEPDAGGTRLTRRMELQQNLLQWLTFYVVLFPVRIPSAKRSLQRLKEKLESQA
jgi:hypothetical protein